MPTLRRRAFEAAARHLSLTKAAAELNVSPGAVSHQIRGARPLQRRCPRLPASRPLCLRPQFRGRFSAVALARHRDRQSGRLANAKETAMSDHNHPHGKRQPKNHVQHPAAAPL